MIELSLITLLNTMSGDFCESKKHGYNNVKSTVIALTHAQDKYGGAAIRRVIKNTPGVEAAAVASVVTKCPGSL